MDSKVINKIKECLKNRTDFLLSGGAGSGKTYSLIETIDYIYKNNINASVACITFTNVAANEIKSRHPYTKLHVSTIHEFLWAEIKNYQKNLKEIVLLLVENERKNKGSGLPSLDGTKLTINSFEKIDYKNYRNLSAGIVSHDDIIIIAHKMFEKYPLLSKIIADKFDFIFIDEYQDTHKMVVEIFLNYIKRNIYKSPCIGLFGDSMQSIYGHGVGNINSYIKDGKFTKIVKVDNYRCSKNVIILLNKIRSDIIQQPAKIDSEGNIINKDGRALFLYSSVSFDFNLEQFKDSIYGNNWNFNDIQETKILYLTHRLSADQLGFSKLLEAYKKYNYTESLIGDDIDIFAKHLLKIAGVLSKFRDKNFSFVIENIDIRITSNLIKKKIISIFSEILTNNKLKLHELIEQLHEENIILKDDLLIKHINENPDFYKNVKDLHISQIIAYYQYYNNYTPYSTQHGVKGAEFNNVLVVLDNGGWTSYNFKYYFEEQNGKKSIIERTKRLFYVCCSRSKDNLIVYYPNPTPKILAKAKLLFGEENVHSL